MSINIKQEFSRNFLVCKPIYFICILLISIWWSLFFFSKEDFGLRIISMSQLIKDFSSKSPFEMNNCEAILQKGRFLEVENCTNEDPETYNGTDINCIKKWKPDECDMHYYSTNESKTCLKTISSEKKILIIVGDSRMRFLFRKFVWHFERIILPYTIWNNSTIFDKGIQTNFIFLPQKYVDKDFVLITRDIKNLMSKNANLVVVFGVTLHMMVKYERKSTEGLETFQKYLSLARENIHEIGKTATVLWFMQAGRTLSWRVVERKMKFWFPSEFAEDETSALLARKIKTQLSDVVRTNPTIRKSAESFMKDLRRRFHQFHFLSAYNKIAEKILNGTSAKIWYSAKYIGDSSLDDFMDHTHFAAYNNYNFMQIIINMMCNRFMGFNHNYCCSM